MIRVKTLLIDMYCLLFINSNYLIKSYLESYCGVLRVSIRSRC